MTKLNYDSENWDSVWSVNKYDKMTLLNDLLLDRERIEMSAYNTDYISNKQGTKNCFTV